MKADMDIGTLLQDMWYSTMRWLFGLSLGAAIAVVCHVISSPFLNAIRVFGALADFLRAIPIIALVPTFIVLFGAKETGKFVMIAWASGLPIYVHLCRAAAISSEQKLVFAAARMTGVQTLLWLKLPALLVASVEAIRISLGIAWISVVAAEMLGVYEAGPWSGGLGFRVTRLAEHGDWALVGTCLMLFGLLGLASAWLYSGLTERVSRLVKLDIAT